MKSAFGVRRLSCLSFDYSPYGRRTVFLSPGTNDPDCHAPTHISTRWTVSSTDQPWGLCEVGFQGLIHDEQARLVHNRARTWHPRLGRFLQRDPLGYVDGMSLYGGYHVMHGAVDPLGGNSKRLFRSAIAKQKKIVRIMNKQYAGKRVSVADRWKDISARSRKRYDLDDLKAKYPNGVQYDDVGLLDLKEHAVETFKPGRGERLTGDYRKDAAMAFEKHPDLQEMSKTHVWHHQPKGETMVWVPKDLHRFFRHTGGAALLKGIANNGAITITLIGTHCVDEQQLLQAAADYHSALLNLNESALKDAASDIMEEFGVQGFGDEVAFAAGWLINDGIQEIKQERRRRRELRRQLMLDGVKHSQWGDARVDVELITGRRAHFWEIENRYIEKHGESP